MSTTTASPAGVGNTASWLGHICLHKQKCIGFMNRHNTCYAHTRPQRPSNILSHSALICASGSTLLGWHPATNLPTTPVFQSGSRSAHPEVAGQPSARARRQLNWQGAFGQTVRAPVPLLAVSVSAVTSAHAYYIQILMKHMRKNHLPRAHSRKTLQPPHRFEFICGDILGAHPATWMVNLFEVRQFCIFITH